MLPVEAAALIPIKAFHEAKERLAPRCSPEVRERLARWTAEQVIAAAGGLDLFVVCDDEAVAGWAEERGAHVLLAGRQGPQQRGQRRGRRRSLRSATTTSWSPTPTSPDRDRCGRWSRAGAITLVPDRRDDGTNVISFPTECGMPRRVRAGSFRRHLAAALALRRCRVEVVRDRFLALDIDTPADLAPPTRPGGAARMAANEPGQPSRSDRRPPGRCDQPRSAGRRRRRSRSARTPTTSSSAAAATLAKWAQPGCVVHHLVCTDGSKGTWDRRRGHGRAGRAAARRSSARRPPTRRARTPARSSSSARSTASSTAPRELRGAVATVIRRLRPEVVLGHDPWKRYRIHPDHRHAGLLACDAIVAARDPHFFREHGLRAPSPGDAAAVGGRRRPPRRGRHRASSTRSSPRSKRTSRSSRAR